MNKLTDQEKVDLAKSLDISVVELDDILKAGDADEDLKDNKSEDEDKEEAKEDEVEDLKKALTLDISSKIKQLHDLGVKLETKEEAQKEIVKSEEPDLIKSFGEMKEDLMKSIGEYKEEISFIKSENNDLKKSIGEMQETLNKIAANSQGTKGMRFGMNNVLEKSLEVEEKEGKKFYSSRDKRGILKAMDNILSDSKDEDLLKSMGDDMIQLESTGQITSGAIRRLNDNGVYLKEQE